MPHIPVQQRITEFDSWKKDFDQLALQLALARQHMGSESVLDAVGVADG